MSTLKKRKILLLVIIGLWVVSTAISIWTTVQTNNFVDYAAKHTSLVKDNMISGSLIGSMIISGITFLFLVFPVIFLFFSKNKNAQTRKWPYILFLTLGTIMLLITFLKIYKSSNDNSDMLSIKWDDLETKFKTGKTAGKALDIQWNGHRALIEGPLNKEYGSVYHDIHKALVYTRTVIRVILIGLYITMLVLIKKSKNEAAALFSQGVKATGENIEAKQEAKENDLP